MKILKCIIWLCLFIGESHILFSQDQLLPRDKVNKVALIEIKLEPPTLLFPDNLTRFKKTREYAFIENPYLRYTLQGLKSVDVKDSELKHALDVLFKYAENDTIKEFVDYLKEYVKNNGEREKALNLLKEKSRSDSLEMVENFVSYLENDSNYFWLNKIGRDSVHLNVFDAEGNQLDFWLNNNNERSYRFWPKNRSLDSVGAWLHVLPGGNFLKIVMDDDVYQSHDVTTKTVSGVLPSVEFDSSYYMIQEVKTGVLYRRYWAFYSDFSLSFGQGFQANWSAGGENSLSMLANIKSMLNYNKKRLSWENYIHYRLGFLQTGDADIIKNEDKIEFNSKLGYNAVGSWYYTGQLNAQTLLFNAYEYPKEEEKNRVGNFLSPLYLNLSLGIDYKPSVSFSLYLSPIAGKWTYVRDSSGIDVTRYGVEAGKKLKGDAGARIELKNQLKPWRFLDIKNELILFSSYNNSKQNIFVDWQVQLDFRINYFMRTTIYTYVLLDKNYSKKFQFKETLNLGIHFRF
ncbi:DUF3078 domain-containing protein [Odoribacter sp. OttesenSCG-928-J03]|nr:DUF3078 domain-containing protein [Odoribacter sp. OttesenSCG-928-J03]